MTQGDFSSASVPFWERKTLSEMSDSEWESLCDGCGMCCLHKLEHDPSGEIFYTNVACRLLDLEACRCTHYAKRAKLVPDCVRLDADKLNELRWMPASCAYRRLHEGRGLAAWHPLRSGRAESVHEAGCSARGRAVAEHTVDLAELEDHIVRWKQLRDPKWEA